MVGMIVPREAIKSGITNTNPVKRLLHDNDIPLSTSLFKTEFLGIQLDAAYDADEHTVSEVTQVLSALSENNAAPEQFTAVYNIIGQVIQKSLTDFNLKEDQLADVTKIFMKNIQRSTTVNNARVVLANIENELSVPYSDKTIFKQFIATVISNINKEFIRNKIAGAGMVMNPSQGMIKLFEDSRGKTYLAQDLINRFNLQNRNVAELRNLDLQQSLKNELEREKTRVGQANIDLENQQRLQNKVKRPLAQYGLQTDYISGLSQGIGGIGQSQTAQTLANQQAMMQGVGTGLNVGGTLASGYLSRPTPAAKPSSTLNLNQDPVSARQQEIRNQYSNVILR